jgi:tRNA-specific 2-thiouridylase
MSGGVDSSVAAALLRREGHEVVGATMKLWGGPSDSGCCSVADVEDARRVCQQLGLTHHVFNFTEDFDRHVVDPYVDGHRRGLTPNPCVECNRHLKFDRFLKRAHQLGFDAIASGHYARVLADDGRYRLLRALDQAKDQSYVLHMLNQEALARTVLPVGTMAKAEVRMLASELGLRTAAKPDSQDVCFITKSGGREAFLGARIPLRPGRLVDISGSSLGTVPAVELVTVGQRRGLGAHPATKQGRRFVVDVDVAGATVTMGSDEDLMIRQLALCSMSWTGHPVDPGSAVQVQSSAHGAPVGGCVLSVGPGQVSVDLTEPQRRVAPGQSVVLYRGDEVLGGGIATGGGSR